MKTDYKNKSNSELTKTQKDLNNEFEKVRLELIKLYDYWLSIEKEHKIITEELNNRFGINNK